MQICETKRELISLVFAACSPCPVLASLPLPGLPHLGSRCREQRDRAGRGRQARHRVRGLRGSAGSAGGGGGGWHDEKLLPQWQDQRSAFKFASWLRGCPRVPILRFRTGLCGLAATSSDADWLLSASPGAPLKLWRLPAAGAVLTDLKKAGCAEGVWMGLVFRNELCETAGALHLTTRQAKKRFKGPAQSATCLELLCIERHIYALCADGTAQAVLGGEPDNWHGWARMSLELHLTSFGDPFCLSDSEGSSRGKLATLLCGILSVAQVSRTQRIALQSCGPQRKGPLFGMFLEREPE